MVGADKINIDDLITHTVPLEDINEGFDFMHGGEGICYIFGAMCPQRGVGAGLITPAANTEMMNLHLAEISTQVASGAHAVLVCDNAGWHQRGKALRVPANITLLALPPYSPELNPIEKVWDYLRQSKLCALVWESYDDIVDACATAWNWLIADPAASSPSAPAPGPCVEIEAAWY